MVRRGTAMVLMGVLGALLVVGLVLTILWGGLAHQGWEPEPGPAGSRASDRTVAARYLRGVAVALVGGFWAGALVTGPAVRLAMRLLAVTAGDGAQGRLTEAEQVVGEIDLGGTIGLVLFGGILPGLVSGAIYVVCRRWLPSGRLGGVTFGLLHLVLGATRLEPLRPDNPDFDLVGPGWLAVLTFGLTAVVHGMAVVAVANRWSRSFPSRAPTRAGRVRAGLPLVLPVLLLVPGVGVVPFLVAGLVLALIAARSGPLVRVVGGRTSLLVGRAAVAAITLLLLPGALDDVVDIVDRDAAGEAAPVR